MAGAAKSAPASTRRELLPGRPTSQKAKTREPIPGFVGAPARIAQRFAPRTPAAPKPQSKRPDASMQPSSGLANPSRRLTAVLVCLALLPNLTLSAYVWLPRTGSEAPPAAKLAEMAPEDGTDSIPARPVLTAPSLLDAHPDSDVALPIAVDGTDAIPARSVIAVSGLPEGATLSTGRPYGTTGWNLRPDEIGDVLVHVPDDAHGEAKLAIELITPHGEILASAETALMTASAGETPPAPQPSSEIAVVVEPQAQAPTPVKTEAIAPAAAETGVKPAGTARVAKVEAETADSPGAVDPAPPSSSGAKPMTLATPDPSADDAGGDTIEPAMYVNLRKDPNSQAQVLGVVPKGAKLAVLDRKRGWVQVNDPATAEKGWIYAGNLTGAPKRLRRATRAANDEPSIWSRMGDWIGGGGSSSADTAH